MSNHSRDKYPRQQQVDQRQRVQDQKQRQQQQIEEKSLSTNSLNDKLAVAGNSTPTQGNAGNRANKSTAQPVADPSDQWTWATALSIASSVSGTISLRQINCMPAWNRGLR